MKTYVIGRSRHADVSIVDGSVARRHAELVVTDDGRCHLTDCATETGTWRRETPAGGAWRRVRQAFVGPETEIRLGDHLCTPRDLIREAGEGGEDTPGTARETVQGAVERDPLTGEIIRRRL